MLDEMDNILADVRADMKNTEALEKPITSSAPAKVETAPKPKENLSEDFTDDDSANPEDPDFDPDKVPVSQRKTWPKKYLNALSRRDQERNTFRSKMLETQKENDALKAQITGASKDVKQADAQVKAVANAEPDLKDPKYANDYGQYLKDVAVWNGKTAAAAAIKEDAEARKAATELEQREAASSVQEKRIMEQATELMNKDPDVRQVLVENFDLISNIPQPIVDILEQVDQPVVALVEIAKVNGGLAALAKLPPAKAAAAIAHAHMLGMARLAQNQGDDEGAEAGDSSAQVTTSEPKKASSAPTPMKSGKAVHSGKKKLTELNADELFQRLGIE